MSRTLLIELGCEELPAKLLQDQAAMLADGIAARLLDAGLLEEGTHPHWMATPRRLAVAIPDVAEAQPDRTMERLGPAEQAAFDADGQPTRAAEGFARSVGVPVEELERVDTEQGRRLFARVDQPGQPLSALLPDMLAQVVRQMAGARSMRWSGGDDRFLRPVRWIVALHGDEVVDLELFGLRSGRRTRGHRVHSDGWMEIESAGAYESVLESGHVIVDFERRRDRIRTQIEALAERESLSIPIDDSLLDEVTGLVEWPVAVVGSFEEAFLEVPAEAIVSSLREHQKSFPVRDAEGRLTNRFVSVANIESTDPARMIHGFERVIRPRLGDARFFYEQDRQQPLAERAGRLEDMLFQERLGTLADKSGRLVELVERLSGDLDADAGAARRAAALAKCDLLTEMVGEFPELQGTMGRYYALADGESEAVARAIEAHYLPRHAGDRLPQTGEGRALALADRLDTLVGILAAGKKPKGGKDPFALRRAAQGIVRILADSDCRVGLEELVDRAAEVLSRQLEVDDAVRADAVAFIGERMRSWLADEGFEANTLHAVDASDPGSVPEYLRRARAVQDFADDPDMESLIAANKRAANLLRQAGMDSGEIPEVDPNSMEIDAERDLFEELSDAEGTVEKALEDGEHAAALARLAALRPVVDRFFDEVMVMVDDEAVKTNRLALLARLRRSFLRIADVARLGRA
ncbi:MAG: glycine--tRNA ligase subunit beta [Wenzhouxiangellaceae bacterium]|nr:glycine--tRNA ligase subunit beta [Wenzhouxiangellaceae bacterium]